MVPDRDRCVAAAAVNGVWQSVAVSPSSPYQFELTTDEHAALVALTRPTAQARMALRARIVSAAADGATNTAIAEWHGVHVDTVRMWRARFWRRRLDGLGDARRAGRPRRFTAVQAAQVKALACELPATRGISLSRWSAADLADEAVTAGIVADISASTVARWLAADAIKPWQHRSWIFPRDPDFAAKAGVVLDLYAGLWQGEPLGDGDYVISADEKTSIQARCRCHPSLPPGLARRMRVEHEYDRGGALAYLAALDSRHRHGAWPLRIHHRHRPFHRAGQAGHDHRTMRLSPAGVLDRRQRLLPPRVGRRQPDAPDLAHRTTGSPARTRQLAEPDRDLLLHRATQSRYPERLLRPDRGSRNDLNELLNRTAAHEARAHPTAA